MPHPYVWPRAQFTSATRSSGAGASYATRSGPITRRGAAFPAQRGKEVADTLLYVHRLTHQHDFEAPESIDLLPEDNGSDS